MKNITIRDVARECGVSTQTISRVINESQNVNEKTRKLVKEKIRECIAGKPEAHAFEDLSKISEMKDMVEIGG